MESFNKILERGTATTEEAMKLFDQLDVVGLDCMIGRWCGSGFHTNHPLDGLLEAFNWYGKEFIDAENVHPLLFVDNKGNVFSVNPRLVPINLIIRFPVLPGNAIMKRLFLSMKWMLKTDKPGARIRMMEYRGKVSAAMIYDNLPIVDIFRKVDDGTLLGVMDLKGMKQPFFFVLKREESA
ncbi:MAG: DUF4334 domain-containing protein [Planctomycetes bacterium]|nr:DUF4334 domain-containing protein [Planctomycetota bacterium]